MKEIITEGKTREDALTQALHKLGVDDDTFDGPDFEDQEPIARAATPEQDQAIAATVRDFLSGMLQKMGVALDVHTDIHNGVVTVSLEGDDSGMIIGKFGQTLDSLQYLTNVVIGKQTTEKTKVVIQVGDYRRRREASLRRMAKAMAYKVLKSKKKVVLAPMPPQDRRIIHLALSNFRHISTGSEGVGPDRRVIISYKS